MITDSAFKPAWWLPNSHAQTVFPTLTRRRLPPVDTTECIELPDGDFIDLAWAVNGQSTEAPLVIILHGLGGGLRSSYVAGFMSAINNQGWRALLMHFRGASKPNRLPRAYHSGDTLDVNYVLHALAQREPHTKKAVIGVSLGGNVLLKWLGERGKQNLIETAIAISVPFQLRLVADRISRGFSRLYQGYLLRNLKAVFERKIQHCNSNLPEPLQNFRKWQCFWTFDEYVTAPLHGFRNVHAYYREASSRAYLRNIATPTLVIHSLDDPFMTPDIVPLDNELSPDVVLELSQAGGHVGFISGQIPGRPIYWLEKRIIDHLNLVLSSRALY
jgi:predicted alpha/beta-fold hydrolase